MNPNSFWRKASLLAVCAAAALWSLAGCGSQGAQEEPAPSESRSGDAPAAVAESTPGDKIVIGFIVKQPEEPWFQNEWKFAEQAGQKYGFELKKIGATDGEKVLAAIDNLAANGAQGFIICTPDVRLGPSIVRQAERHGLKLLSVDDRFVGPDGEFMENVHYLGISARKIGENVGKTLYEEMQRRAWPLEETAACRVTFDELDTARERTEGATDALVAAGFPAERIYSAPQKTSDVPGAFDAVSVLLTQRPEVKRWLVYGMNDNAVLGAVRAMENRGFAAESVIGVGINGTDCIPELQKSTPTGFYGSMLLAAKQHGFDTAEMMYKWIKEGAEPPLDTRTVGILIIRENFEQVLKDQGVWEE